MIPLPIRLATDKKSKRKNGSLNRTGCHNNSSSVFVAVQNENCKNKCRYIICVCRYNRNSVLGAHHVDLWPGTMGKTETRCIGNHGDICHSPQTNILHNLADIRPIINHGDICQQERNATSNVPNFDIRSWLNSLPKDTQSALREKSKPPSLPRHTHFSSQEG